MSSVQFLHQGHLSKRPTADDLQTLKILLPKTRPAESEKLSLLLGMDLTMFVPLMEEQMMFQDTSITGHLAS